jgi:serine/threonine protein kinase
VGDRRDWEELKPLGSGGQSKVYLVRRRERVLAREKSLKTVNSLLGQGMDRPRTEAVAGALADVAREDLPSELAALKEFIPRPNLGKEAEASALSRLHNEIEILGQGRPGLLKLLDSNEKEKWIVTEYCANETLEDNLHLYKGDAQASLAALLPIIEAVAELHREDIVHRDIKPQNIFVDEHGRLVLGDFGLVFLPDQAPRITKDGESVGPSNFMPPWVDLEDKPSEVKQNLDVYMLGKVLWCMVAGKKKLPRESFLEPRFNLTTLFPNEPKMYAINRILENCVVQREEACLGSAIDLLPRARGLFNQMRRGGQLLELGVPRPCRVCGVGQYQAAASTLGKENPTALLQMNRVVGGMGERSEGLQIAPYVCNNCNHVEFFKTGAVMFHH